MVRPTINSEKHIVQFGFDNADIGSVTTVNLAEAIADQTRDRDVRVGAVIKAIYVELWFQGEGMATGRSIACIEKTSSGQPTPTVPNMLELNTYENKKNVLFTHQGLSSDQNTNAVPVHRGWLKIPKGKQRFGLGDRLKIQMLAQIDGFNFCGLAIFKEYY